ncbi:hypothetical protein [Trebonia sp.]|uniref:hypothetical protein n=1 Tax=Trebonia sp. TaxID=2767075 RepID=UPI00262ED11E|nr:hypothetical protein [Trebonia sp.]
MGTVIVNDYTLSTSADPDTVAVLLGKVWTANSMRARIGQIQELGRYSYRLETALAGTFDVQISPNGRGSVLTTMIRRSRTTQAKFLLLIPLGPKKVHANILVRTIIEKGLSQYLIEQGYEVTTEMHSHPLNR